MSQEHTRLAGLVFRLRWAIPLVVSVVAVGYVLIEQVMVQGHGLATLHVVRMIFILGLIGPALSWLTLTWAVRLAQTEAKAQEELAALSVVGAAASQSLDLDEVLQTALDKMVELLDLEAGEIRLVEGEELILKTHHGVSADFVTCESTMRLGRCLCGRCAKSGVVLAVDHLAADPSMADSACMKEGFQSTLSVPMKAKERVVGVIHMASRQRRGFTHRDQQTLTAISDRVATAVENARLYEEVQRRAMHLETANLVGLRTTALLDLDTLLAEVVRLIRGQFGYYQVHILLTDEEAGELVLKEASGPGSQLIKERGLRLQIGQEGVTGRVADTGQPWLCNDVRRDPHYYANELAPETRAELAVPLRAGNRIIGVLDVQSDRCGAFERQDVTVLQVMGNQVGIAIENARLFQETKQRYQAMIALHETSLDIVSQLDMSELLEALLRRGVHLLGAQAGSLFLYDAAEELIYNAANHNTWREWTGVTLRPGEGVIGQVILTGEPLIVNDYENWSTKADVFADIVHTRVMGAPLRWRDQTVGGVVVLNEPQTRPFGRSDLWLLSLFADLAIIAIKNAEFHTDVKMFNEKLEREVDERTQDLSRAKEEIAAQAERLRSLLARTINIQEAERARIARDMHDGIVQLVTAARYEVQAAKVIAASGLPRPAEEKLSAAREVLQEIDKEIRRAIYDLHPSILDAMDLVHALQKYANDFQELSDVACHVQVVGNVSGLPPQVEVNAFRMVQEALQNVAAHARATTASVTVEFRPAALYVAVQDDGQGFDYQPWLGGHDGNHLGLLGMRERIEGLGGEMEIRSKPGHGTRVVFCLPVQGAEGR